MDRDCNTCIWHTSGSCANWDCEYVSRHEALEALRKVKELPPDTAHWIVYEVANTEEEQPIAWVCSECEEEVTVKYKYCPGCGCLMEGGIMNKAQLSSKDATKCTTLEGEE